MYDSDSLSYSDSEEGGTILLKPPAYGNKRWRKRQRRIVQGKFQRRYKTQHGVTYYHTDPFDHDSEDGYGHIWYWNDYVEARDTGFADTFLFKITLGISWAQLSGYQRHDLSAEFPTASSGSASFQRFGTNLPEQTPPELFDFFLPYLDKERSDYDYAEDVSWRTLQPRKGNTRDNLSGLRACSLVCRHWANLCRRLIFSDATLSIESSEDADLFLKFATEGCPSLEPVYMLVRKLTVQHNYDVSSSFLHRLHHVTLLNDKLELDILVIEGPVPDHFPRHRLGTPHWSVPSSVPTPPALLQFTQIHLVSIHLPSLRHVVQYVRHLTCAKVQMGFTHVTWNDSRDSGAGLNPPIPRFRRKGPPPTLVSGSHKITILVEDSTDNFLLCLYAAMARTDCPLHWLADVGRMIMLLTSLWELCAGSNAIYFSWNPDPLAADRLVNIELSMHRERTLRDIPVIYPEFTIVLAGQALDSTQPTLQLVAFRLKTNVVPSRGRIPVDVGNLLALLTSRPELRLISLEFMNYKQLQRWMQPHSSALQLPPNNGTIYTALCQRAMENQNIALDDEDVEDGTMNDADFAPDGEDFALDDEDVTSDDEDVNSDVEDVASDDEDAVSDCQDVVSNDEDIVDDEDFSPDGDGSFALGDEDVALDPEDASEDVALGGEYEFVRINPVTLEPIGSSWRDRYDLEYALYKEAHIL